MALKHSLENNGLQYMEDVMYRDNRIGRWRMKDWGNRVLDNARQQTQDPGWWHKLCAVMCGDSEEALRHNVVTRTEKLEEREWKKADKGMSMREMMPEEIGEKRLFTCRPKVGLG